MKLNLLSYKEIEKYLQKNDSLLIPVGTCEQHGLHLPLCTDTIVAERMCDDVSKKMGILVAPTVNYGVNLPIDDHMTVTSGITYEILKATLESITTYWAQQGFKHFFFVSCHGDFFHVRALNDVGGSSTVIEGYDVDIADLLDKQVCARHACEAETSVMLYLYPKLVNMDKAKDFDVPIEKFLPYLEHKASKKLAGYTGNIGYSTYATKEKGKQIYERMMQNLEKIIKNKLTKKCAK